MEDIKWHALTAQEAASTLKSDLASGLSQKEAARRYRRYGENRIYKTGDDAPFRPIIKLASDVTLIIMLVLSVLSAFFGSTGMSLLCVFLTLGAFAFSSAAYMYTKRYFESAAARSMPTVRVRRDGRIFSISLRRVVEGDIILLRRGDIVPCDCRLISSTDLKALEFTGRINGKDKHEITKKNADRVFLAGENPNVAQQENMIGAAAAIVSGSGVAIAVRCGSDTFITGMKGELELAPDSKKTVGVMKQFSAFTAKVCLVMLICALPVTLGVFFIGRDSFGLLDTLMILSAITVTSGSEALTAVMYIIPMLSMMRARSAGDSAEIKFLRGIGELNYNDSVILYGDEALSSRELSAERIFASNMFFSAEEKQSDKEFVSFVETAILGTAGNLVTAEQAPTVTGAVATAVLALSHLTDTDPEELKAENTVTEFKSAKESGFDTTLVKNGENYTVICTSPSPELLSVCTHMRTPSGILPFTSDKKSDIVRACAQFERQAKSVLLVASADCKTSSLSRLAMVQSQLIFDGYIEFAAPYVRDCRALVDDLRSADQNVYFFAPENGTSVITAFNTGIVSKRSEIAYASHFRANGHTVGHGLGEYRAYLGFSGAELRTLTGLIRGENGTVSMICSDVAGLSASGKASTLICVSGEVENRRRPTDRPAAYSEIIKKNSDVIIPPADAKGHGLKSFMTAFACSKNACTKLCGFLKYLLFSQSLRLSASVIPMIIGKKLLLPVQILILGFAFDFTAAVCFALSGSDSGIDAPLSDIETVFAHPLKAYRKYPLAGLFMGCILVMLSAMFGFVGGEAEQGLSILAFGAVAACQICATLILAAPSKSDMGSRALLVALAVLAVLLLTLGIALPSFGALVGISVPGWQTCVAVPVAAVIGYVVMNVTEKHL